MLRSGALIAAHDESKGTKEAHQQFWEHNDEHTPTQTSSCRPPCSKRHPQAFQQTDLIRASIHQAPLSPEPST